ncbi:MULTISPECIES: CRISPR-associated endonuclease Cas2 [unclassified Synechococcus]|uniref:CRISPR-associated endonuclease Cas2 n=1 Tax=unclassified Synechococcus TaxID=2626047 RepID=UPI0021A6DF45|nr:MULTISPECIES: CRISPR-associated endonuclease Cas2 [unclassified Synechococcus]MCT0212415.1 CRISPR-associated endonuclease Cas2 [Synechococcus sp. CS-1326]MCT0234598.1 CRISPR-associated endonuclease Cas2 [Synechococcus sp. CS-1327]
MADEQLWVIAYDSPSNKRRRKLAKLLEGYGVRVQWSVFECNLRKEEIGTVRQRLTRLIQPDHDSVRLWPVPEASCARIVHLGKAVASTSWDDPVI